VKSSFRNLLLRTDLAVPSAGVAIAEAHPPKEYPIVLTPGSRQGSSQMSCPPPQPFSAISFSDSIFASSKGKPMRLIVIATIICFGTLAFAADPPQQTPEQIAAQQKIDQIKADTALLQAQTAQYQAQQDAEKARRQAPTDQLTAQKGLVDAQNASVTAQNTADAAKRQAEIDKLKAQKDLITAATPNITGAPKGTVTFDDKAASGIENTVKAYEAVHEAAATIAQSIRNGRAPNSVYVILSANDANNIAGLSVFEAQAALIGNRLESIDGLKTSSALRLPTLVSEQTEGAEEALGLLGPAVTALTGLVGLFKVDDKYVPKDESPDLPAFYGAVAAQLQGYGTIYYPEIMPANLFEDASPVQATLMYVSSDLDKLRATYYSRLADKNTATKATLDADAATKTKAEIDAINKQLADPTISAAKKKELETSRQGKLNSILSDAVKDAPLDNLKKYSALLKKYLDDNDKYIALLEAVLKSGDDYIGGMTKSDASSTSPLLNLIAAERVRRIYRTAQPTAYALQLSVQRLSGTRREHTNFFGTSLSFSGGVVASYRLFAANSGILVASQTVQVIKPFTKN
jgi:hypothetical protein